jgi:hypothetical protein
MLFNGFGYGEDGSVEFKITRCSGKKVIINSFY